MLPQKQAIEIDEASAELLAKMDARGVTSGKLMVIFGCNAEELAMCREAESYKSAHAAELLAIEQRAAQLDDTWDDIEGKALGDLKEMMTIGAIADPRQLLFTASTANKMARRSSAHSADGLERMKAEQSRPVVNGGQQVVIRLRTRFVEQLNTPAGHSRLLEREAEVVSTSDNKMVDEMGANDVRRHLTESLGINLDELKSGGSLGPDSSLADMMAKGGHRPVDLPADMFAHLDPDEE